MTFSLVMYLNPTRIFASSNASALHREKENQVKVRVRTMMITHRHTFSEASRDGVSYGVPEWIPST